MNRVSSWHPVPNGKDAMLGATHHPAAMGTGNSIGI